MSISRILIVTAIAAIASPAKAATVYADSIVDYSPGFIEAPADPFTRGSNALGAPDVNITNGAACFNPATQSADTCLFASLGDSGLLTVEFTGSVKPTADGDAADDISIFEVGVAESATVEVSEDLATWFSVGTIPGGAGSSIGVFEYGFDLDSVAGIVTGMVFPYVRIVDVIGDETTRPQGVDIDAIGAEMAIPLPAAAWLFPAGLIAGLGWMRRQRQG